MKTSVYIWRVTSARKATLEQIAREQRRPVAELLDEAVGAWLKQRADDGNDEAAQLRLHKAAACAIGRIAGGNPRRAENAREAIRKRFSRSVSRDATRVNRAAVPRRKP